ncbi:hypothetical protein G6F57_016814 [Rhizopus arrhizus]|nr:hypothetical protein G6F57_016814 [Rhizopus arrhizus]
MEQVATAADARTRLDLAGSGFRDFTRIAAGSPEMWRDIFLSNRDAMLAELADVRAVLDRAERAIADGDNAVLLALLETAAQARRNWRKDISNRVLLLSAIAEGTTVITGLRDSDDTRVMLGALRQLGVQVSDLDAGRVTVEGVRRFPVESADLFMGNAGTAIRPLTAALALMGGDYRLSGVPRMHERPIGDLADALNALGARIDYLGQPGYPPLHIGRGEIAADAVTRVQGSVSSQFLTALLLAAPLQAGRSGKPVTIEVVGELISKPYIEITLNLMARFGVQSGPDRGGRRCLHGVLFPGAGCDWRRSVARDGRGR